MLQASGAAVSSPGTTLRSESSPSQGEEETRFGGQYVQTSRGRASLASGVALLPPYLQGTCSALMALCRFLEPVTRAVTLSILMVVGAVAIGGKKQRDDKTANSCDSSAPDIVISQDEDPPDPSSKSGGLLASLQRLMVTSSPQARPSIVIPASPSEFEDSVDSAHVSVDSSSAAGPVAGYDKEKGEPMLSPSWQLGGWMRGKTQETGQSTLRSCSDNLQSDFSQDELDLVVDSIFGDVHMIFAEIENYRRLKRYRLMDLFRLVDKDNSGEVRISELLKLVEEIMPDLTPGLLQRFVSHLDTRGIGRVSYKSMSNAMKRSMLLKRSVQKPLSTKRLHVLVDALGENLLYDTLNTWHLSNNGYLTVAQTVENLRWALPDMPMETLQSVADELISLISNKGKLAVRDIMLVLKAVSIHR